MRGRKPETIVAPGAPIVTVPRPPEWFSKDAKAEWRRIAPILITERRTLDVADMATFANYCVAVGMAAAAARIIAAEGIVFMAASGPKKHPAVAVQDGAMTQARLLANELGLTPVSRSRAPMRQQHAEDDDDTKALGL